ncbi:MAG: DUF4290 domain-containing protein [Bacteroidales bacterium]|jgi:hypothetical protein|nr:DUF4290 domain-containing protein [Bacteroidales bacterium]
MLEYNTERNDLIIKEYGRNIQKMIEYAGTIKDYKKRTETARAIVKVMSQINPDTTNANPNTKKQSESPDYWNKLWDHLFIISNYQLDVDSPFPKPKLTDPKAQVVKHDYRKTPIRYRTYGRNMEQIIKTISQYPEKERDRLMKALANHLKKLYLTYNRDSVDDNLIVAQLFDLSGGKLALPNEFILEATRDILRQKQQLLQQQQSKDVNPRNNKNRNKNNNNNKKKKK